MPCFNDGCIGDIAFYRQSNRLIICFNVGKVECIGFVDNNKVKEWLNLKIVKEHLYNDEYDYILFCGHSNGMATATLTTFVIFLYYMGYYEEDDFKLEKNILDKINVCGTGGFPCVFNDEDTFKAYYNALKGRYLHIISGINISSLEDDDSSFKKIFSENTFYLDIFASEIKKNEYVFKNYKYYIYTKTINKLIGVESNEYASCYVGLYIGDTFIRNKDYSTYKLFPNNEIDMTITAVETWMRTFHNYNYYRSILNTFML